MLKPSKSKIVSSIKDAAASARLCVETVHEFMDITEAMAAASARLCVETFIGLFTRIFNYAAASARLCVETFVKNSNLELKA